MLQQTTVTAVVPYFERFLARFPNVESLAAADEHEVFRVWEGLGYYSRARNLHTAAKAIVAERNGRFPTAVADLIALPGIGRYTAGAIASFAFDTPAPIVEANTLRLYCRLIGYTGDPRSATGQQRLWSFAEQIVPKEQPGRFNHALMDLGATVCTPESPACDRCPVRPNCIAFERGLQREIPRLAARAAPTDVVEAYIVVRKQGSYLLRKRQAGERWAGLWDFPRCELTQDDAVACPVPRKATNGQKSLPLDNAVPPDLAVKLEQNVSDQTGMVVGVGRPIAEIRHSVTRFRIRVICFDAEWRSGRVTARNSVRWVTSDELGDLALSRPGRRLAELLQAESLKCPGA